MPPHSLLTTAREHPVITGVLYDGDENAGRSRVKSGWTWHACRVMRLTAAFGAALLLFAQVGCGLGSSPDEVAADFWTAVAEGQFDEARALVIEDDPRGLQRLAEQEIQSVEVGEALTEGDVARVETRLERERGPISFQTRLRRFDQGWRVDSRTSRQA